MKNLDEEDMLSLGFLVSLYTCAVDTHHAKEYDPAAQGRVVALKFPQNLLPWRRSLMSNHCLDVTYTLPKLEKGVYHANYRDLCRTTLSSPRRHP